MEILKKAYNEKNERLELAKKGHARANKIYTCEYEYIGCICEFEGSLKEIDHHLEQGEDQGFTEIVIYDWDRNIVATQ